MRGKYIKHKIEIHSKMVWKWIKTRPFYFKRYIDRRCIRNRDFSIISNNCWGGHAYRYFGREYSSPTVGLYFPAKDYIKFVYNLRYYLSLDLKFIPLEGSGHEETIRRSGKGTVPIGVLDDVQIVFLHYQTEKEAYEKWNRRKARINYKNIIIKFSDLGPASEEILQQFNELPFKNKFMIVNRKQKKYDSEVLWQGWVGPKGDAMDTDHFPGNLMLRRLLDRKPEEYPEAGYVQILGTSGEQ